MTRGVGLGFQDVLVAFACLPEDHHKVRMLSHDPPTLSIRIWTTLMMIGPPICTSQLWQSPLVSTLLSNRFPPWSVSQG